MDLSKFWHQMGSLGNLSRIKWALIFSFSTLMLTQFFIGFRNLEDYLVVLVFVLFLNDLYTKIKYPDFSMSRSEKIKRIFMSVLFLFLFVLPLVFDGYNVSNATRWVVYKLGFVLWAQVFLIDSYIQYNYTQSKRWLVFANTAVLMIIFGAFAI